MRYPTKLITPALAVLLAAGLVTTSFASSRGSWGGTRAVNNSGSSSPGSSQSGAAAGVTPFALASVDAATTPVNGATFTSDTQSFSQATKKVTFNISRSGENNDAWSFSYRVGGEGQPVVTVDVPSGNEAAFSLDLTDTTTVTLLSVTDGDGDSATTTDINTSLTVQKLYTLSYDANGGAGDVSAQSGIKLTVSDGAALSRDGYAFKGWNTKADGSGAAFAPGGEQTLSADVTLYAQWEITAQPPSFTLSGASIVMGDSVDLKSLVGSLSPAGSHLVFYDNILCREVDKLDSSVVSPALTTSYWVTAAHPQHPEVVSKSQKLTITVEPAPSIEVVGVTNGKISANAGETVDLTKFAKSVDGAVLNFYEGDKSTQINTPSAYKAKKSVKIYAQAVYTPTGQSPLLKSAAVTSGFVSFDIAVTPLPPVIEVTNGVVGKGDTVDLHDYVTKNDDGAQLFFYTSSTGDGQVDAGKVKHTATQSYDYYVKAIKDNVPSQAGTAADPLTYKITLTVIEKPVLTVKSASIKKGGSVDLSTLITNVAYKSVMGVTYYSDAECTSELGSSVVTPSSTGTYTYYAKAVNSLYSHIYTITPLTVTVSPLSVSLSAGRGPEASGDSPTEQAAKTAYSDFYLDVLEAESGGTVTYNGTIHGDIPFWVVDALAGRNIKLQLTYKDAVGASRTATIDCRRVPKTINSRIFWPALSFANLYS